MKAYGKGKVFHINGGGQSHLNAWKQGFNVSEGVPIVQFRPLVVKPHPRTEEMRAYAAINSLAVPCKK